MKDFNLTACLAGAPVQTRSGKPFKLAGYNPDACPRCRLVGWVGEHTLTFFADGSSLDGYSLSLVMAPVKKEGWVIMTHYSPDSMIENKYIYPTKEWAQGVLDGIKKNVAESNKRHSIVLITWEE